MKVTVEVLESSFVLPSEETPKNSLWLSNLDLNLAVAHSTPTIYVYRSNGDPDFFSVERLKAALGKALVPYYPLAGRLGFDHDGRIQIECTGDGVLFMEARCKCTIDGFGDFMAPSSEMRQMLVPPMDSTEPPCGLLSIQVTFFSCGGVTLGMAANHRPCDGHGYVDFINLWSQFSRGSITSPAVLPILDRSALRARTPPKVSFDHKPEYKPNTFTSTISPAPPFSATILKLSRDEVALIKNKNRFSTFQAVVGHAWRSICIARDLSPNQETRLYFIVNVRGRMNPPLPRELFANVRCTTSAVAIVGNITSSAPTEYVAAEKIQEAVARVSDEYVRSVIDFLEVDKSEGKWVLPSTDVIANTWVGLPVYDVDFGWGKPEFMSRAVMRAPGFVHILPSPVNDQGRVYVMVGLEEENVHKFNKVFYQELNELRNKNIIS